MTKFVAILLALSACRPAWRARREDAVEAFFRRPGAVYSRATCEVDNGGGAVFCVADGKPWMCVFPNSGTSGAQCAPLSCPKPEDQ